MGREHFNLAKDGKSVKFRLGLFTDQPENDQDQAEAERRASSASNWTPIVSVSTVSPATNCATLRASNSILKHSLSVHHESFTLALHKTSVCS